MTRVLVTGINGAIAPFVAQQCLEEGSVVFGSVRNKKDQKKIKDQRIKPVVCDITNFASVKRVISATKPDFVFHLAAISTLSESWKNPVHTMQVNLGGPSHFLEAVRQTRLNSRVVLTGSREEYGAVSKKALPIKETEPLNPVNPYGVAKTAADWLGHQYWTKYGVETIRARPFNHTAPVWPDRFVDSNWCRQIASIEAGQQEPVIKVGNLTAIRDFTDCRDVATAYWRLANRGRSGEAYNICSKKPVQMKKLLEELLSYSTVSITIKPEKERFFKDQVPVAWGDNAKIRRHTGWKPVIPIQQTHLELLEYWRKQYGIEK